MKIFIINLNIFKFKLNIFEFNLKIINMNLIIDDFILNDILNIKYIFLNYIFFLIRVFKLITRYLKFYITRKKRIFMITLMNSIKKKFFFLKLYYNYRF